MGLTLHYTLALPGSTSSAGVRRRLDDLRRRAAALKSGRVDEELMEFEGSSARKFPLGGLSVPVVYNAAGRPRVAMNIDESETWDWVEPEDIALFRVHFEGAETAFFGVARFPETFPCRTSDRRATVALPVPRTLGRWYSEWACKTQYAADPRCGGRENFLRAHLTLIAVLDAARELGFELTVSDEGGYWESRSIPVLLGELDRMDRLVAGFAGFLKDRLGKDMRGSLEGPILARPDFENLEARATADGLERSFGEAVDALLRLTKR